MKFDNMLHCDRFMGSRMSLCGPMLGSFFFYYYFFGGGTKSGQEPSKSDCDTIFVDF